MYPSLFFNEFIFYLQKKSNVEDRMVDDLSEKMKELKLIGKEMILEFLLKDPLGCYKWLISRLRCNGSVSYP